MAASANPKQLQVGEPPEPAKRDFRQEVTDCIINMLENGVAPWQKPWNPADASLEMPMNPTTGKAYRGGNATHTTKQSEFPERRSPIATSTGVKTVWLNGKTHETRPMFRERCK